MDFHGVTRRATKKMKKSLNYLFTDMKNVLVK